MMGSDNQREAVTVCCKFGKRLVATSCGWKIMTICVRHRKVRIFSRTLIKTLLDPLPMVSSAIERSDLFSRWKSQNKGPITVFGVPRSLWKSSENDSRLTKKKSPMNTVSDLVLIGDTVIVNRLGLKFYIIKVLKIR